jgi:hypothetical protein
MNIIKKEKYLASAWLALLGTEGPSPPRVHLLP